MRTTRGTTRPLVLGTLVAVGVLCLAAASRQGPAAAAQQPEPTLIEIEKLRDNLFVLRGGGGNTTVFVQASGVTVVDTKNPGWGEPIIARIRELTSKPITTIVNTHTHGDHVGGNVSFAENVDIVTHANTAGHMKNMKIVRENGGRGLPDRTFTDVMTLGAGNDRVELRYFGRGHTNGDAWVLFPAARVLHAGDIFAGRNVPLLDYNAGASGVQIPDTLMKAYAATAKAADSIVTGHSTVMTPADLREYAEFNRDFLDTIARGKRAGRTVEQIVQEWRMPATYAGYQAPTAARLTTNVQLIYNEIR